MSKGPFPIADTVSEATIIKMAFLTGNGLDSVLRKMCTTGDELLFQGRTYRFEMSPDGTPRPVEVQK